MEGDAGVTALPPAEEVFHFGRLALHVRRRVLMAGAEVVPLNARAFDMLEFLIRTRDRVVGREEISASVWRGLSVGENNLRVQISALRKALADHAGAEQLILTLPGRGYQFVGDVVETRVRAGMAVPAPTFRTAPIPTASIGLVAPARPRSHRNDWGRLAIALGCVCVLSTLGWRGLAWRAAPEAAPRLSIAVMPFRNPEQDQTVHGLATTMTDDLTTDLARMPASTVVARENAAVFRGRNVPVQEIGRALRVRYLVSGNVRVENGTLRVNAQLVDAATGAHLWAQGFNAPGRQLDDARDTIVSKMSVALRYQLDQEEGARSLRDSANNPDALDYFLRARATRERDSTPAGLIKAQALLEKAVSMQPDTIDSSIELADLLLTKVHSTEDATDVADLARARDLISSGIARASTSPAVILLRGRLSALDGDWKGAADSAQLALSMDPTNFQAEALLANAAQAEGRLDEAVPHLLAVLRLRPDSSANKPLFATLGYIRLLQGNAGEAMQLLRQAVAGDPDPAIDTANLGRAEFAFQLMAAASEMRGDRSGAQQRYASNNAIWPNRSVWRLGGFFPHAMDTDPRFKRLLDALHEAGMPWYLNEHTDAIGGDGSCLEGEFTPTPLTLSGAVTADTESVVVGLTRVPHPLVVNLGRGRAVPRSPSLDLFGSLESNAVPDLLKRKLSIALDRPLIVIGDGPAGCRSYNGAQALVRAGFSHVIWYRGGEESWAASSKTAIDRRAE